MDADALTRSDRSTEARVELRALTAVVSGLIAGGLPAPDDPRPPGPWGPVLRRTFARLRDRAGPVPDPWRSLSPRLASPLDAVALNPQPLPPKALFAVMAAEELVELASRLDDAAEAAGQGGSPGSRAILRLAEDAELCPPFLGWPIPPRPKGDPDPGPRPNETQFDPVDLVTLGVALTQLADTIPGEELRQATAKAGEMLVERGAAGVR
jgi:hypothetical protein